MKLVIKGIETGLQHNLRTWQPEDPEVFAQIVAVEIGTKPGKGADTFTIRIATPAGLSRLDDKDGILAERPLLVIRRYDYEVIWSWLEKTVASCQADTWERSVENLRYHFNWEHRYR
jgi:hypothetical protein